jgi:hypothetical protein
MALALMLSAIRRHPIGMTLTTLLAIVTASLLGFSAPLTLLAWGVTGLVWFEVWYLIEPFALQRFGDCRPPTPTELARIQAVLDRTHLEVLIADRNGFTATRGLRCLVIGRDLMDLLEDRGLSGFLTQVAAPVQSANVAGFVLVWLGNLPVLVAWWLTRLVGQLARLLALAVGTSLLVPLVVCREGFLRWTGLVFTAMLVGLSGCVLLSYGFAAVGLGLLLAWLIIPVVHAVLGWESRRIERFSDATAMASGFGPQLLEAVEFLALVDLHRPGTGLLSILCLPTCPLVERAHRIRRQLGIA